MDKILVRYIGGSIGTPTKGEMWGGTAATNYAIKKAFEGSDIFDFQIKTRRDFNNISEAKEFLDGGEISWMDDCGFLEQFFEEGYDRPDIIGPISRSPVKRYSGGDWRSRYTSEYFYNGKVLRLNEAEEKESTLLDEFKGTDWVKKISFIRHGIDLDLMSDRRFVERINILWAGNSSRPAKNYQMWLDIQEKIKELGGLPLPYEFKTMSNYSVDDYWNTLNGTALLVNTSKYESFCCAVAEARSKGAGALVRENFNGLIVHLDQPGQTPYTVDDYVKKILELCNNKEEMEKLQKDSYEYVNENCSLQIMADDIGEVFLEVLDGKN